MVQPDRLRPLRQPAGFRTEPAVKGDTSGKVMKPAKINTGFELPVPLFVSIGDKIEIDTRTNEYRNRVK